MRFNRWIGAVALAAFTGPARAQQLPRVRPEMVGLSSARLARLDHLLTTYATEGKLAGAVTLVLRDGKVAYQGVVGQADREAGTRMQASTLFRIASQSKAVTSVGVMMLVEEGKVRLNDPLARFIPAFATTTVGVDSSDAQGHHWVGRVPPARPITIRDLLTHTAGVSYGAGLLDSLYRAKGFHSWYFAVNDEPIGTTIERLATLPMAAQPGAAWIYGYSSDILGVVIERASGLTLDDFFHQRIFGPLAMRDTYFYVPPEKAARLAVVYGAAPGGGLVKEPDSLMGQGDYVRGPRKSFSGGAGLVSTAEDYARFLQMLLNGGALDGHRLLSPTTVKLMTQNHVGTMFADGNLGFGLGFQIVESPGRAGVVSSPGQYGWGGAYYSLYFVDPIERLVVVFMTQLLPSGGLDLQDKVRALAYQAIVKSYARE
ncbi:MAG: serine hydrolase domain-containing protein [Gemmatimonadota bacterium]